MSTKYPQTKAEMLNVPHWAIMSFSEIYVEGDERSRTNPGHGYPAHYAKTVSYEAYTDEAEWKAEITRRSKNNGVNFTAAYVIPAEIKTEIKVDIKPFEVKRCV